MKMDRIMRVSSIKDKEAVSEYIETQIEKPSMRVNGSMINFLDHSDKL